MRESHLSPPKLIEYSHLLPFPTATQLTPPTRATKILVWRVVCDSDASFALLSDSKSQDEERRDLGILGINLCRKYYKHAFRPPQVPEAAGVQREGLTPRVRDGSVEEQAQRRRRREAIVLNEGGGPVTQEDIIQRRDTDGV
jgi:hypothetical protein